jgi:CheY-like chemotaxis protein
VTIQRVIELTFADEDIRVVAVGDGQAALERIDRERPDIVLADVAMPYHDGYAVAKYIKSRPDLAAIPVVLLAGAFEPVDQARALDAGCDGVLTKPFEPQQVIAKVRELLAAAAAGPKAAAPADGVHPSDDFSLSLAQKPSGSRKEGPGVDEFFESLDRAFAGLNTPPGAAPQPKVARSSSPSAEVTIAEGPPPSSSAERVDRPAAPAADWSFAPPPPSAAGPLSTSPSIDVLFDRLPEKPVSQVQPSAGRDAQPRVDSPPAETPAPASEPSPGSSTQPASVADAFAALLAVEQSSTAPAAKFGAPMLTDDDIDAIVARVVERMTDSVVRETVTELVSRVAERLVREEIERLKATSK